MLEEELNYINSHVKVNEEIKDKLEELRRIKLKDQYQKSKSGELFFTCHVKIFKKFPWKISFELGVDDE